VKPVESPVAVNLVPDERRDLLQRVQPALGAAVLMRGLNRFWTPPALR